MEEARDWMMSCPLNEFEGPRRTKLCCRESGLVEADIWSAPPEEHFWRLVRIVVLFLELTLSGALWTTQRDDPSDEVSSFFC